MTFKYRGATITPINRAGFMELGVSYQDGVTHYVPCPELDGMNREDIPHSRVARRLLDEWMSKPKGGGID